MVRPPKRKHSQKPANKISRKSAPKKSAKPAPKKAPVTYADVAGQPKKKFNYQKAAKKLKDYGLQVKLGSPSGKKKAKSLWKEYAGYINHTEKPRAVRVGTRKTPVHEKQKHKFPSLRPKLYVFKFQKLTKKERELAKNSGLFSSRQFTPSGVFIEKPANIAAKKFKVTFKKGAVRIRGGARDDVVTRLDAENLLDDPTKEIQKVLSQAKRKGKKPKTYSLLVNGFRSNHSSQSLKIFTQYLKDKLLPEWLEKNEGKDENDFADMFHLRIVY